MSFAGPDGLTRAFAAGLPVAKARTAVAGLVSSTDELAAAEKARDAALERI